LLCVHNIPNQMVTKIYELWPWMITWVLTWMYRIFIVK
jgi:hypothetical protein